jgi:hypothetical protein
MHFTGNTILITGGTTAAAALVALLPRLFTSAATRSSLPGAVKVFSTN